MKREEFLLNIETSIGNLAKLMMTYIDSLSANDDNAKKENELTVIRYLLQKLAEFGDAVDHMHLFCDLIDGKGVTESIKKHFPDKDIPAEEVQALEKLSLEFNGVLRQMDVN